jgi:acyl carrier protein
VTDAAIQTASDPVIARLPVDPALREKVLDVIAKEGMIERDKLDGTATLEKLGIDSMEVVMILNGLEDALEIYIPVDKNLSPDATLDDLVAYVAERYAARGDVRG